MAELVRPRSVTVDLGQRKITRAHRLPVVDPSDPVTVTSRAADATAMQGLTPQIQAAIAGEIFNALANPSAYGYPDETNSGYLGDVGALTAVGNLDVRPGDIRQNGLVVATRPGSGSTVWGPVTLFPTSTSIDLMDLTGTLIHTSSYALDVTDSRLRAAIGNTTARTINNQGMGWNGPRATFTDCTIDGRSNSAAVYGHHLDLLRCDVQGSEDVVNFSHANTFTDSYFHDLVRLPGSHNDIFQTGSGSTGDTAVFITHCTLKCAQELTPGAPNALEFPDGWYDPFNAILMLGNYAGPVGAITIDDCLCDGGNYSFNDNFTPTNYVTGPITVQNCRMGRHFRYGVKQVSNYVNAIPADLPTWEWTNNVWDDTGAPCN